MTEIQQHSEADRFEAKTSAEVTAALVDTPDAPRPEMPSDEQRAAQQRAVEKQSDMAQAARATIDQVGQPGGSSESASGSRPDSYTVEATMDFRKPKDFEDAVKYNLPEMTLPEKIAMIQQNALTPGRVEDIKTEQTMMRGSATAGDRNAVLTYKELNGQLAKSELTSASPDELEQAMTGLGIPDQEVAQVMTHARQFKAEHPADATFVLVFRRGNDNQLHAALSPSVARETPLTDFVRGA